MAAAGICVCQGIAQIFGVIVHFINSQPNLKPTVTGSKNQFYQAIKKKQKKWNPLRAAGLTSTPTCGRPRCASFLAQWLWASIRGWNYALQMLFTQAVYSITNLLAKKLIKTTTKCTTHNFDMLWLGV